MKKNFGVKLLVVGLSLFSLVYLSEGRVLANASDNEKNNLIVPILESGGSPLEDPQVSANERNTAVTDRLRSELSGLSYNLGMNALQNGDIHFFEMLPFNRLDPWALADTPFARVNSDMVLKNGETLAAHTADLSNGTGIEQTMSTASFTYKQTDSVTTATTHSTGVAITTGAEMKFPFISGSMSMTARYDFGTTNSVQSTVEKQWVVPQQNIKVPAGHDYKVTWVLNTGVATGTTDLTSSVNAVVAYKQLPNAREGRYIGDAIALQDSLVDTMPSTLFKWDARNDWERVSSNAALRKWGTSNYTAQFGTELRMRIIDVTNGQSSPVIVREIPMNITPKIIE